MPDLGDAPSPPVREHTPTPLARPSRVIPIPNRPFFPWVAPCSVPSPLVVEFGGSEGVNLLAGGGLSLDLDRINQATAEGVDESRLLDRPVPIFATPRAAGASLSNGVLEFKIPCNSRLLERGESRDDLRRNRHHAPVAEYFAIRISDLVAAALAHEGISFDDAGNLQINPAVTAVDDVEGFNRRGATPVGDRFAFEHIFKSNQLLEVVVAMSVGPAAAPAPALRAARSSAAPLPQVAGGRGPQPLLAQRQDAPPPVVPVDGMFVGLGRIRGATPVLDAQGQPGNPAFGRVFITGGAENSLQFVPLQRNDNNFVQAPSRVTPLRRGGLPNLMTTGSLDTYRAADAQVHAGFSDRLAGEEPRSLISDMAFPFPPYQIRDLGARKPTPQQDSNLFNTAMFRQGANHAPGCTSFAFKVNVSQLDAFMSDVGGAAPGLNRDLDPETSNSLQSGAQLFLFPEDAPAVDPLQNRRQADLDECRRETNMNFGLLELFWSNAAHNPESRLFANPIGIRPVGVASIPDGGNWPRFVPQLVGFNQYVPICGPHRERAIIFGGFASDTVRCESDWLAVRVTELRVRFSNTPPFQRPGDLGWKNEFLNGLA